MSAEARANRLLSVGAVARELQVSLGVVRWWIKGGKLPAERTATGRYLVKVSDMRLIRDAGPVAPTFKSGVYFIACGEFVKIGKARDVTVRLQGLSIGNPYPLRLLHYIEHQPGEMRSVERALHMRFKGSFHRGEWFRLDPEIRRYLNEECGVAVP